MRHRHSVTEDPVKVAGIAAIAAVIGAVTALLFTPKNGDQVRNGLKRRANNLKDDVQQHFDLQGDDAEETAEEIKARMKSTTNKIADDTKSTVRKVGKNAKATTAKAKTVAKDAADKATDSK
jgi:gas vesicle protein